MILKSVQLISELTDNTGGGKAQGLALLHRFGLLIPRTYVITANEQNQLTQWLDQLPDDKLYAVRSSASGEDGELHSFAGQFQTFLNVKGTQSLLSAINKCFESAVSKNVESYSKNLAHSQKNKMFVLVQEMVEAKISGVIFTADPVENRHDKISLSYTVGIGEELMSGHTSGESLTFYKNNGNLPESNDIKPEYLTKIISDALSVEKQFGKPADLEWALDNNGKVWWLQLRPVTGLSPIHLNELDHSPRFAEPIYTRGNIGEMMPGPVTPLTLSTFAKAIEFGMQDFYLSAGVINKKTDEFIFIHSYYNHLFFDVKMLYEMTKKTLFARKENIDYSVVGDIVKSEKVEREVNLIRALKNFLSMNNYMRNAPKAWVRLRIIHKHFRIKPTQNIWECFDLIDYNMPVLFKAYDLHYVTSSQSGSLYTAILNFYSKGKMPGRNELEKVAALFINIPNIESANVIESIEEMAGVLASLPDVVKNFIEPDLATSLNYLKENAPEQVRELWKEFVSRHGHRCVREAEMRELEWEMEPSPVLEGIKAKTLHYLSGEIPKENKQAEKIIIDIGDLNLISKIIVSRMLPKARKAVARREQTKGWAIGVQHQFKLAYRHLAKLMVKENMLDDSDQIFFLQHIEIGEMLRSGQFSYWKNIASERRNNYQLQLQLSFPDVCYGIPFPVEESIETFDGSLSGVPVSRGIVTGPVRIVNSMDDAKKLLKGEIMVAKYTDIGWTPFYGVLAGLITEIGSPLSHGAVVAREYNLPAVVSMKGALSQLKTGQVIRLNADKGIVEYIEKSNL